MQIPFAILIALLALTPALIIANNTLLQQVAAVIALLALAIATAATRGFEIRQLIKIVRPVAVLLALPAIWMIVQATPIPVGRLTQPIWASSASYLQAHAFGYISLDQGKTLGCLLIYGFGVAIIILTILLARDRKRAEQILLTSSGVTVLTVLLLLVIESGHFDILKGAESDPKGLLPAISSLGMIFCLASAARVAERRASSFGDNAFWKRVPSLIVCAIGFLICFLALVAFGNVNLGIVATCAIVTFASVQIFRRFDVAQWSIDLFLLLIGAAAVAAIWHHAGTPSVPFIIQFADMPSSDAAATAARIYADTGPLGNGAGTYAALFPMYRIAGQPIQGAPTIVTALAIEWGLPALLVLLVAVLWLVSRLVHGALSRGRDSFYPAAAAACTVILLGQALCSTTISQWSVMLIGEVMIGLGLAQSIKRTG
ncbi:hypothetical protein SAMN05444159_1704 [Bradyrhizobium lablabi]|uniref:O-antigen ligase n=1 Tax=Bradyrhizobium lablabi TaxID=722472 RepID=A0A1M6MQM3_9BRAD|nr:hypothetical protein [Bradyrhizobium lablabi]SHJ85771.1 hypothetical protein SAMN05444159_1704 [Bradyrhizobium lablabi]